MNAIDILNRIYKLEDKDFKYPDIVFNIPESGSTASVCCNESINFRQYPNNTIIFYCSKCKKCIDDRGNLTGEEFNPFDNSTFII